MHQATSLKFAGSSRDGRGFAAAISPYGWFGHGERARQGQISSFDGGRSWPQAVLTLLIAGTLLGLGTCLRGAMPPRTPPKRAQLCCQGLSAALPTSPRVAGTQPRQRSAASDGLPIARGVRSSQGHSGTLSQPHLLHPQGVSAAVAAVWP